MGDGNFWSKLIGFLGLKGNPGTARIQYVSDGRSGHIWYRSPETEFAMYYDFDGHCVVRINIPSLENWEEASKLPLERRDEVLDFIGRQVAKDQVSTGRGYFKVEGNWINIYA